MNSEDQWISIGGFSKGDHCIFSIDCYGFEEEMFCVASNDSVRRDVQIS